MIMTMTTPSGLPIPLRATAANPRPARFKPGAPAELLLPIVATTAAAASASVGKAPLAIRPTAGASTYRLAGTIVPVIFWPPAGRAALPGAAPNGKGGAVIPAAPAFAPANIRPTATAKSTDFALFFSPPSAGPDSGAGAGEMNDTATGGMPMKHARGAAADAATARAGATPTTHRILKPAKSRHL